MLVNLHLSQNEFWKGQEQDKKQNQADLELFFLSHKSFLRSKEPTTQLFRGTISLL